MVEQVTKMKGYVPKGERQKIILMCDDARTNSGIATVAREIILHTAHKYNILQIGAAMKHPDEGKRFDLSESINEAAGIPDADVQILANSGYGTPDLVRQMLKYEKPDAIFIITDPRYWAWLFQIENEVRKHCPIVYLNIWDDYPAPMYNKEYYESCDLLMGISKQTVNINKLVLGDKAKNKVISYVPHGLNSKLFYPIDEFSPNYNKFLKFKEELFGGKEYEFVAFFNSRNIRRKQIPDTIWAYKQFVDKLTPKQAEKCAMVLHTNPIDNNGTDLFAVIDALCGEDSDKYNFIFSNKRLVPEEMNLLYNCTDVQIQLTSNEGWGLSLTEAMLVGNPIIANVTGGMQDQMRFTDEKGNWFTPCKNIPSNNTGTYKKHGKWAFPVFPSNISIQGSVPTPYIFDDRCSASDAANRLYEVWEIGSEERKIRGNAGRKWALGDEAGFTAEKMAYRIIDSLNELFKTWTPREKYELLKVEDKNVKFAPHKLEY